MRDRTRDQVTHGSVIRRLAFVVLLALASTTALAGGAATLVSGEGTPIPAEGGQAGGDGTPAPEPGPPRYPDLVALPPEDLYFSTELIGDDVPHHLLRFTTSVENSGEGPLELVGSTQPGAGEDVVQTVYDMKTDGTVVEEHYLGIDLIFHPEHHHFHLNHFASYELLREEPNGDLVPIGEGGKQSSCLLDTLPVTADLPYVRTYEECELERQGISVGWKDVYSASLPDQWVDLGSEPLTDGAYVLRYSVDPLQQIEEDGRTGNNVGETRFTVRNGEIVGRPEPPRCAIEGDASGLAGADITLRCSHFSEDVSIDIYWGAWDPWDTDADPIAELSSHGTTASAVTLQVPDVPPGSYTITAVAWNDDINRTVSATVIYGVQPEATATPT